MILYNMLFGQNPLSGLLVEALGVSPARFRDAWVENGESGPVIAIHTRTGGGNRECFAKDDCADCYHTANEAMEAHPLYLRDEDDDFDSTYATFYFKCPTELEPALSRLVSEAPTPREKWQQLFDDLGKVAPETDAGKRAVEVGKRILAPVIAALASPAPAPTEGE